MGPAQKVTDEDTAVGQKALTFHYLFFLDKL